MDQGGAEIPASQAGAVTPTNADRDVDLSLRADASDEERAIIRGRTRGARDTARILRERAEAAKSEAARALDLAVSALAEADGLRRAMASRSEIDVAKGVLVERHGVDPERAFEMLVSLSQRHHSKLVDVARTIVEGAIGERI